MSYQDANRTAVVIERWRAEYSLSPAEVAVVRMAVDESSSRTYIATHRNVQESTVKKQVNIICQKTGARSLADIVIQVLREVVYGKAA